MKILNKMVDIFLIIAITFCLSLFVSNAVTGKPTVFGFRIFYIASESMEPTIMTHQFVLAIPIDPENVRTGDIIAYQRNGMMEPIIIHRVKGFNADGSFCLKGDNNNEYDAPVKADEIKYKIIWY